VISYKTPMERIVERHPLITGYNVEKTLNVGKFVVTLACGHMVYTRAQHKAMCPRCTEMLKRSIETGKEDYESFRKGLIPDTMEWDKDPCRQFNERFLAPLLPTKSKL